MKLPPNRVLRVEGTLRGWRRENWKLIDMANGLFLDPRQKCVAGPRVSSRGQQCTDINSSCGLRSLKMSLQKKMAVEVYRFPWLGTLGCWHPSSFPWPHFLFFSMSWEVNNCLGELGLHSGLLLLSLAHLAWFRIFTACLQIISKVGLRSQTH